LRRHENIVVLFLFILCDLVLFVTCSCHRNGDFDVSSDLGVVFSFWVTECEPLMKKGVLLHEVDETQVEFKLANQGIFEETFVQKSQVQFGLLCSLLGDV